MELSHVNSSIRPDEFVASPMTSSNPKQRELWIVTDPNVSSAPQIARNGLDTYPHLDQYQSASDLITFSSGIRYLRSGAESLGGAEATVGVWTKITKRAIDILLSSVALLALSPIFLVIALLIKWKTPGPVLFSQERSGRAGKPFTCFKFRTMVVDAQEILNTNQAMQQEFRKSWKIVNDPRVTRLGLFLRKTSLDELPQLWNVLKGDMSIVGPRPVLEKELHEQYADLARVVTMVRPGMTGLWQVSGRSSLPYEQRINLDVQYVRRHSIWFDFLIILRTIPALLGSKDAH